MGGGIITLPQTPGYSTERENLEKVHERVSLVQKLKDQGMVLDMLWSERFNLRPEYRLILLPVDHSTALQGFALCLPDNNRKQGFYNYRII